MRVRILLPACMLALATACSREPDPVPAPRFAQAAAIASGGLYTNCAACHGAAGEGGPAPPLKGNARLAETNYTIGVVLQGSQKMPAFAVALSDDEIARLLTTIRKQWGNDLPPVMAAEVALQRAAMTSPGADSANSR